MKTFSIVFGACLMTIFIISPATAGGSSDKSKFINQCDSLNKTQCASSKNEEGGGNWNKAQCANGQSDNGKQCPSNNWNNGQSDAAKQSPSNNWNKGQSDAAKQSPSNNWNNGQSANSNKGGWQKKQEPCAWGQAPGSYPTKDGGSLTVDSDGTKTFRSPDGSYKIYRPDGTGIWKLSDGSQYEKTPDGRKIHRSADGQEKLIP